MPKIFVFTAGNPEAQKHLDQSVRKSVDSTMVFEAFESSERSELERIAAEGEGFFAWGALPGPKNIPTWEHMEIGDYIFCAYESAYRYAARILKKYNNAELAEKIWV